MRIVIIKAVYFICLTCCLVSCSNLELVDINDVTITKDGKLRFPLTLETLGFEIIETRNTTKNVSEKQIQNIGLLVFEATGGENIKDEDRLLQKVYIEPIDILNNGPIEKTYIELSPYDSDCHIVVYANLSTEAQERMNNILISTDESDTNTSTWADIKDFTIILSEIYPDLDKPGETYSDSLPMSSEIIYLSSISPETTNNLIIPLNMCFARLDINCETLTNFDLINATLLNGEKNGALWHNINYLYQSDWILYSSIPASANRVSPIYLYPTSSILQNENILYTDIIIQGKYLAPDDIEYVGFYKIRIKYEKNDVEQYAINPNILYHINIHSINGPGYATFEESITNTPHNIMYDVVIDTSNKSATDMVITNGSYYLGVSNSDYHLYSTESCSDIVATILTHNAPEEVKNAYVEIEGDGLSLLSSDGMTLDSDKKATLNTLNGSEQTLQVKIAIDTDYFTTESKGVLHIRIGDLVKNINVYRSNSITGGFYMGSEFADSKIVRAEYVDTPPEHKWIKFSEDFDYWSAQTQVSFDNPNGGIYCFFLLNDHGSDTRVASLYFGKKNEEGRLKVDIFQPPASSMPSGQWNLLLTHYNLDAHYDFRPLVIRSKQGHSSIRLLDVDMNEIGDEAEHNWMRLSEELQYPGTQSGLLKTYIEDINHNIDKDENGNNVAWTMLYVDEYVDLSGPRKRNGNMKFCYTLYDDPKLLKNDSTLSFLPAYKPFDQLNIVNLGYFGGDFDPLNGGYSKQLGIENREEHKVAILSDSYDSPLVNVPWGINKRIGTSLVNGLENTINLYKEYGNFTLPENPLHMIHKTYAAAYCMYKNRDLDGNGLIEGDEIKWYLPARNNMIGVNIFFNSGLFLSNGLEHNRRFYTSSEGNSSSSIYYNHFNYHYNSEHATSERIRCVRNIGESRF